MRMCAAVAIAVSVFGSPAAAWAQETPNQVIEQIMRYADRDRSGHITAAEFNDYFPYFWPLSSPPSISDYDHDRSGTLAGVEFRDLAAEIEARARNLCDSNRNGMYEGRELECVEDYIYP